MQPNKPGHYGSKKENPKHVTGLKDLGKTRHPRKHAQILNLKSIGKRIEEAYVKSRRRKFAHRHND